MAFTPFLRVTRRAAIIGLASAVGAPSASLAMGRAASIVTMLGDSITAGYGLSEADALPAQLALRLKVAGQTATVRAAGVSGDTTADALARADFSVQSDTTLCLVALGGNDLLQGVDPRAVRANLDAISRRLKARRIGVLIAGMKAPPALGASYARDFNAAFIGVARAEHVALYPFLLDGVAANPRLNQKDGIHPNAAGVKVIAARLAPAVVRALSPHLS